MANSPLLTLYTLDQRINSSYPDVTREVTPELIRHIDHAGRGEGSIIYSQLNASNADQIIQEQIRYFAALGQDFEWKLFDYDEPADLKERLAAAGFVVEEAEAILVLDLATAPAQLWQPIHHDVRQLTDPASLSAVEAIEAEVWQEEATWVHDYLGNVLRQHPERMSVYAVYVGGQPASAAWVYYPAGSQFASLWGGSTIERYRRQGLYTALLAARAQEARSRGVRYLTVDASPMSRPILEKLGFQFIAYSYPCKWRHAG